MVDRSFEERVREEMAGLSLKPGAEVWEQIELAIYKEKKRRWFVWLFLLLGGCGAGSFLLFHGFTGDKKIVSTETVSSNKKQNNPGDHSKINMNKVQAIDSASLQSGKIQTDNTLAPKISYVELNNKPGTVKMILPAIKTTLVIFAAEEKMNIHQSEKTVFEEKSITENRKTENLAYLNDTADKKGIFNDSPVITTNEQQITNPEPLKKDTVVINEITKQDDIKPSPIKNTGSLWQFGISVDLGKSGISQLQGQSSIYTYSGSSVSQPGSGSLGSPTVYKTPSLTDGFSFGINVQANKKINQRYGFTLSLGYQFYQSQIGIGNRVDSTTFISSSNQYNDNGYYYLSTDNNTYSNRFHLIQTGFSLYADRIMAKNLPVRWHIGTGTALLISSDALHYDAASGILFKSRSLLNNIQLNFSTGFDLGIGKKPFVYIGPQLTYFITHPSQQPGSTNQHLFRAGLRAVYILPKKKT